MIRTLLPILVIITSITTLTGQKQLLFEKAGRLKPERFHIGEPFTFKLNNDTKLWYDRYIEDINQESKLVRLGQDWIPINEISNIKLQRQRGWVNVTGAALQAGGISSFTGDLFYTLRGEGHITQGGMEFGVLNFAVGTGLRFSLAKIYHKLSDRKRLRVIDLTF